MASTSASAGAAAIGLFYPKSVISVTDTTITALSVMFGLAMAVHSFASQTTNRLQSNEPNDPLICNQTIEQINEDDKRTVKRQEWLTNVFLIAILTGIAFKVSWGISKISTVTSLLSAAFAFFGTLSLLGAFFLPSLLSKMSNRNKHFDVS
ncbi:hypothetical protein [Roseovarius pacificus]|uniref:hypothetical protein n=1 Tax=Roseovarius pacificus TaxID=337701 RepID=UPI002A188071|nr:hypothetical protein [Roseovarius pacificus]